MVTEREDFVRNCWYGAMWSTELVPGVVKSQTIVGRSLVFYRSEDAIVALQDKCPHRFAPLSWGKVLENGRLQCGYHGLEFSSTGTCVHNPFGNGVIPPTAKVQSYPAVEKHRMISIWMGNAEPDCDMIPDFSVIDEAAPVHVATLDHIRIAANYRLVIDNLLDPSHIAYLHAGTLGNADMANAAIIKVDSSEREVTLDWSASDVPAPNILRQLFPPEFPSEHADFWTHERWMPASNILLQSAACPTGSDRSSGTGYYGIHIITPETPRSTLYNFTSVRWQPLTPADRDQAIRENLSLGRRDVFVTQDGPIIEAQQRNIDEMSDAPRPALLAIDVAPVRYGRILDNMIQQQTTVPG